MRQDETVQRLRSECMSCLLKNHLEKYPLDTPETKKVEYMQRILQVLAQAPRTVGAPVIVRWINEIQKEMFGVEDTYADVKLHFNEVMKKREAEVRQNLNTAEEPLKLAIQYAMIGNYIDFGAMKHVDEDYLTQLFLTAKEKTVNPVQYERLKDDLQQGRKLVYLTDNCGEIVMDKLLIELIQTLYPQIEVTVLVRGSEILNDATMADAKQVGLTTIAKVIGNGNNIAGTCLEELSKEAAEAVAQADVIIAKGQGNYETLRGCGKNIYYIFLCKCHMFAETFGVPRFTGMLVNDSENL